MDVDVFSSNDRNTPLLVPGVFLSFPAVSAFTSPGISTVGDFALYADPLSCFSLGYMGNRGVIGDKWSMRILWLVAIGSAAGLYMVAVERQTQNRQKMMAEQLKALDSGEEA